MSDEETGARLETLARGWATAPRRSRASKLGAMARHAGALLVAIVVAVLLVRPILRGRPQPLPAPLPDGTRFGLKLVDRKRIFGDIARAEASAETKGKEGFPGDPWSAQDHAASYERDTVRDVASRYKVTLTQAYLILDEGIRDKWPVGRGRPLDAAIVPLHPRRSW